MKRIALILGAIIATIGVIWLTIWASEKILNAPHADACATKPAGATHIVYIKDAATSTRTTTAKLCDQLVITNQDPAAREIAFGQHDHHMPYDGIAETILSRGQSLRITLRQTGTYEFHDHFEDSVAGFFTVH